MGFDKRGLSLNLTLVVSLIIILGLASFVFAAVIKISPVSITPEPEPVEQPIETQLGTESTTINEPVSAAPSAENQIKTQTPELNIIGEDYSISTMSIETTISSCTIISAPGLYTLTTNIINSSAVVCINITASNVIFDGAGYMIDGVDAINTYGVHVHNSSIALTNTTVKNQAV